MKRPETLSVKKELDTIEDNIKVETEANVNEPFTENVKYIEVKRMRMGLTIRTAVVSP